MTEQQPERRWSSGLAGYAPPTSDLKDSISQAHIPTRWIALTQDAQGRLSLGPLRPPVMVDARALTNAQIIAVFADLIRRSLAPTFVLLDTSQRAAHQFAVACLPIAVVAGSPPLLIDWLTLSRTVIHVVPRHQIWLGLHEPAARVSDGHQALLLTLDALLGGTPTKQIGRQIQRLTRSVAHVLTDVRRVAQIPVDRREAPETLAQRIIAALDRAEG
jgi:hypothetical protein